MKTVLVTLAVEFPDDHIVNLNAEFNAIFDMISNNPVELIAISCTDE